MVKAEEDSAALEAAIDDDRHHIVNFDGPTDPDNAVNWPAARKWLNVFVLAAMTFIA
jgi:4-hydroxy-L-threonine phosphate dehydrogenase PdxA